MSFPLYQDLIKNVSEEKISDEEKAELIKKIKKIDEEGHELIYALIKAYQKENGDGFGFPYDSKMLKLGLKFDLDKIPNKCIRILIKFCDKHLEKMKEDSKLNKGRK